MKLKSKISNKLSLFQQIFITIIFLFLVFILVSYFFNQFILSIFYEKAEFSEIENSLIEYVDNVDEADSNNYYDLMYNFTNEHNAYSVILDGSDRILVSNYFNYSIIVKDTITSEEKHIIISYNTSIYDIGDNVTISATSNIGDNEMYFTPRIITLNGEEVYNNNRVTSTIEFSGTIISIEKPNNINYMFASNNIVLKEVNYINTEKNMAQYEYGNDDYTYLYYSESGNLHYIVFVKQISGWNKILTIIPISNTDKVVGYINSYNILLYFITSIIVVFATIKLSRSISKPINIIEQNSKEIAKLNFDEIIDVSGNREVYSLSTSIHLIASNLRETIKSLQDKSTTVLDLYEQQSKQMELKKQLVSSISHELKTPLMIMQVTVQGLIDGIFKDKDVPMELNNVINEITKSSNLIHELIQIYRIEDSQNSLKRETINLSEIIKLKMQSFDNLFKKTDLHITLNIENDLHIYADSHLIERVISNYVTNVLKYTPPNNDIYLNLYSKSDLVIFELLNQGVELSAIELQKIGTPFFRGNRIANKTVESSGTGIGYYMIKTILTAHNFEYGIKNSHDGILVYFLSPIVAILD